MCDAAARAPASDLPTGSDDDGLRARRPTGCIEEGASICERLREHADHIGAVVFPQVVEDLRDRRYRLVARREGDGETQTFFRGHRMNGHRVGAGPARRGRCHCGHRSCQRRARRSAARRSSARPGSWDRPGGRRPARAVRHECRRCRPPTPARARPRRSRRSRMHGGSHPRRGHGVLGPRAAPPRRRHGDDGEVDARRVAARRAGYASSAVDGLWRAADGHHLARELTTRFAHSSTAPGLPARSEAPTTAAAMRSEDRAKRALASPPQQRAGQARCACSNVRASSPVGELAAAHAERDQGMLRTTASSAARGGGAGCRRSPATTVKFEARRGRCTWSTVTSGEHVQSGALRPSAP